MVLSTHMLDAIRHTVIGQHPRGEVAQRNGCAGSQEYDWVSTATGEFVHDAKRCGWGYLAGKRATTARCQPHLWQEITDRAVDFGSVRHAWGAVQFSFAADRRGRSIRHHPKMRFSTAFRVADRHTCFAS
jgi:hypothetical protein